MWGRYEYLPPADRQFRQRLIQFLNLKAGTGDLGGIRAFIGNIGDGGDSRRHSGDGHASAPVLRDMIAVRKR